MQIHLQALFSFVEEQTSIIKIMIRNRMAMIGSNHVLCFLQWFTSLPFLINPYNVINFMKPLM